MIRPGTLHNERGQTNESQWSTIQKKKLKSLYENDAISNERDQKNFIRQKYYQFQFIVCATEMYNNSTASSIPKEALSQYSQMTLSKEILKEKTH